MSELTGRINSLLNSYGVKSAVPVRLSDCRIIRADKLTRLGLSPERELYAYIFYVPYLTPHKERNISAYAVPRDYHLFFSQMLREVTEVLSQEYPDCIFAGFSDNSPIDERHAAAVAGLGILGKNNLLITKKHSSYVFIGEIITDCPVTDTECHDILFCEDCGRCTAACPKGDGICLSELTQKKGELTQEETDMIAKCGCAWGCDVCQEACPHTKKAIDSGSIYTDIDFFLRDNTPLLSRELIESMSDKDFGVRAYSWRKRSTILRNLKIIEEANGDN